MRLACAVRRPAPSGHRLPCAHRAHAT